MLRQIASMLLMVALVWPAVGCRCRAKPEQRKGKKAPMAAADKPTTQTVAHFPSEALRFHMRHLEVLTREIGRRAKRGPGQLGRAPRVLLKKVKDMPTLGAPKRFTQGLAEMAKLAQQLDSSQRPKHHYGLLVEACVSCHKDLAPGLVRQVERLRLEAGGK